MGTSFEAVYDRATTLWTDYRLDNLYKNGKESFMKLLKGFLLNSIDEFDQCLVDLKWSEEQISNENEDGTVTTITKYSFDNDLSSKEIRILALGMCIAWFEKDKNDVTQFRLHLSNKDYKTFSESQNIKQRQEVLEKMREEHDRNINEYLTQHITEFPYFNSNNQS